MPPRRSTRAASTKPTTDDEEKPATKPASKKPASKAVAPKSTGRGSKRAASPENDPPPAAKRTRAAPKIVENGVVAKPKAAPKNAAPKKAAPRAPRAPPPPRRPRAPRGPPAQVTHFNALPTPPEHVRPAAHVFIWGDGSFGQFGMGPDLLGEFTKPKKNTWVDNAMEEGRFGDVPGAGFEAIAGGGLHSLFIDERGTVWSCGVNDDAALGRITTNVPDPANAGQFLDADTLTTQPWPLQTLVDENFRAVRIAAGDAISAAISDKGDLRVWGSFRGVEGILGFSNGNKHQFLPAPILELRNGEKFVAVVAGNNHLLVLTSQGHIYVWGAGEQGQLGRRVLERHKINGTAPERVVLGSRLRKAVVIGAGSYTSFAVDSKGDVWAWGLNNMGQTGTGWEDEDDALVPVPKKVVGLSMAELGDDNRIVQIAGGEHHTLFLTSDGKVYTCGRTERGQLGLGNVTEKDPKMNPIPTLVPIPHPDDPIVHISVGIHNNMAVSEDGVLYAWGAGPVGELGTGPDDLEVFDPTVVVRREGSWATIVTSCGGQHSLGLLRRRGEEQTVVPAAGGPSKPAANGPSNSSK